MPKRPKQKKSVAGRASSEVGAKGTLPPSPSWRVSDWWPAALLIAAVILAYLPVWQAGFIWDDDRHLTREDLRSWFGLERIWTELGATQQYYPLVHSTFWVEHALWGDAPLGYHLINVLLLICSALLLCKILRRLEVPGAWLAAGVFALHPMQVESVAWVTELKNMLSGVFYFASALVYLDFDRSRKGGAYAGSLILFEFGLLSKSVIATLPAALLVIFWWKRGKLSWKHDVPPLIPFFVAGTFSGLLTAWVERHLIGAQGADFNFTWIERILIAGHVVWFYLGKFFWPVDLIFIYPRWEISQTVGLQYLFPAAALILAAALAWLSRRWRGPLAGFLFFVGTLFPVLGFFNVYPFQYSFVADHFQYLACLGIIVPCSAGAVRFLESMLPGKSGLQSLLGAGLLLILATLTWRRAWAFESAETLWTDTLSRNPACGMAYDNLGVIYYQKGRIADAVDLYQKAFQINPDDCYAHKDLGIAFAQAGKLDDAISQFQSAVEINPKFVEARYGLGTMLAQKGQFDDAVAEYRKALEIDPYYTQAVNNLGVALAQEGKFDEAITQFRRALDINPAYAEAHNDLGLTLERKGQMAEAVTQFQEALRLQPDDGDAKRNLDKAEAIEKSEPSFR